MDAEVNYRKALEVNPKSTVSMFNLGNTLTQQNKLQEAMEQYVGATKIEKDKSNLAQIYHNMGVIFHSQKDYAKAVEAYKESLRNNPKDDETRYNLALAQKQLQDQQQNQDQNQDQDKQDQQKEQDKQQDQQKDQQQNQDQQQQPSQPEKKDNEMSKENAEQLLNSVMQDEKDVQDKVKKAAGTSRRSSGKRLVTNIIGIIYEKNSFLMDSTDCSQYECLCRWQGIVYCVRSRRCGGRRPVQTVVYGDYTKGKGFSCSFYEGI